LAFVGVVAGEQQGGGSQGMDQVTGVVDLGVESAMGGALVSRGAAELLLQGGDGRSGLGELAGPDVFGDYLAAAAAFAVVVGAVLTAFPGHGRASGRGAWSGMRIAYCVLRIAYCVLRIA
jgi:hypothetical protein